VTLLMVNLFVVRKKRPFNCSDGCYSDYKNSLWRSHSQQSGYV